MRRAAPPWRQNITIRKQSKILVSFALTQFHRRTGKCGLLPLFSNGYQLILDCWNLCSVLFVCTFNMNSGEMCGIKSNRNLLKQFFPGGNPKLSKKTWLELRHIGDIWFCHVWYEVSWTPSSNSNCSDLQGVN